MQVQVRTESVIRKVKEALRGIQYRQGRNPSDSKVAAAVGVSVANVRLARKCYRRAASLYSEIGIEQARQVLYVPSISSTIVTCVVTLVCKANKSDDE